MFLCSGIAFGLHFICRFCIFPTGGVIVEVYEIRSGNCVGWETDERLNFRGCLYRLVASCRRVGLHWSLP
ncbi:hypothetical protein M758_9G174900 [Ceratodon purpureus]|nr:hypothetical protein M758_9G174900 [Ceratodon purpureus]